MVPSGAKESSFSVSILRIFDCSKTQNWKTSIRYRATIPLKTRSLQETRFARLTPTLHDVEQPVPNFRCPHPNPDGGSGYCEQSAPEKGPDVSALELRTEEAFSSCGASHCTCAEGCCHQGLRAARTKRDVYRRFSSIEKRRICGLWVTAL